jgi:hypothetical protein
MFDFFLYHTLFAACFSNDGARMYTLSLKIKSRVMDYLHQNFLNGKVVFGYFVE